MSKNYFLIEIIVIFLEERKDDQIYVKSSIARHMPSIFRLIITPINSSDYFYHLS